MPALSVAALFSSAKIRLDRGFDAEHHTAVRAHGEAAPVRRRRLAIIGLGKLGIACGKAIAATEDLALAGIVRRPANLNQPLPPTLQGARVATHASDIDAIDAALICLPPELVLETATDLLQHRVPIVEAAILPAAGRRSHREAIQRVAHRHRTRGDHRGWMGPGSAVAFPRALCRIDPEGAYRDPRPAWHQPSPYARRPCAAGNPGCAVH